MLMTLKIFYGVAGKRWDGLELRRRSQTLCSTFRLMRLYITVDYQKHNKTLLEPLPESSTQANVITPYEGIWNKHDPLSRLFKVISLTTCPQSSYTTGTCHVIDGGWSIWASKHLRIWADSSIWPQSSIWADSKHLSIWASEHLSWETKSLKYILDKKYFYLVCYQLWRTPQEHMTM